MNSWRYARAKSSASSLRRDGCPWGMKSRPVCMADTAPPKLERKRFATVLLFGAGDFVHNFLGRRARIGCRQNGASHDDEIGSGANSLARSCRAHLVVFLRAGYGLFGTHPRGHNQEFPATGFANGLGFANRSHHAIDTGLLREFRELH